MARGGIFRKDWRRPNRISASLPPEVPIEINLSVIDITVEVPAITHEIALVDRPGAIDVTVELPAVTVEQPTDVIADLDPIDIEIFTQDLSGEKYADLSAIDITTELPAVTKLVGYALQPIDIQIERPVLTIIQTSYDIDAIDIQVLPQAVDPADIVDVPPVQAGGHEFRWGAAPIAGPIYTDDSPPLASATFSRLNELGPSEKIVGRIQRTAGTDPGYGAYVGSHLTGTTIPGGTEVRVSFWYRTNRDFCFIGVANGSASEVVHTPSATSGITPNTWTYVQRTFTTLRDWVAGTHLLRVGGGLADTDYVDFSDAVIEVNPNRSWIELPSPEVDHAVDLDPIDITTELTNVQVIQTAYLIDVIDIQVTPQDPDVAYSYDLAPIDITTQLPALDPARITDINPIDITTQLPQVIWYQSWRIGIIDVTTVPQDLDLAHIHDIQSPVDITTVPQAVDPAIIVDLDPIDIQVRPISSSTTNFDDTPIVVTVEVLPVDVGFGVEQFSVIRGLPAQPVVQPTRVIAQSILTKEFLHWELPVSNIQISYALSGPGTITGEFSNEVLDLRDVGLEPYGTWIHIEENGFIRASGILMPTALDQNEKLSLEAVGVSSYPAGIPYTANFSAIGVDPADVVRHIWAHLQSFPDGNLGVVVNGSTNRVVGEPIPPADENGTVPTNVGPYKLDWWEAPDCGTEIGNLAQETPFDFVERSEWNADKTEVKHYIDIGYPRIGARRYDLRFAQDENLLTAIGPEEVEGFYASTVILMGKGEGSSIIRGYAGRPSSKRIRRVAILDDATVDNVTRANALCGVELDRRQAVLGINEVEIDARHPNAPLGSFVVGDEVQLWAYVPWIGEIKQWQRITGYTYSPETDSIRVEMQPSEAFTFGSTPTPPSTPPSVPTPPAPTVGSIVEFNGDFSPGNFSQYSNIQNVVRNGSASGYNQQHYSARVEAAGDNHPDAFRCEVRGGDIATGVGGARCEIRTSSSINWQEGEERWFEFSIKFASNFPKPGTSTSWCIPLQFHAGTGSPPVALNIPPNLDVLRIENHADSATYPPINIGPIDKGNWVDYVLHIKFHNDPAQGFVEVYRNKTLVVPKTFRRTMNSTENYLKLGMYRDTDETQTMVLWHDGMRITRNA